MATPKTVTVSPNESADAETEADAEMTADGEDRTARQRILASAERLFAERGFDRTSTARIADAANVPHGLIFYYFKTKMDLLLAVTEGYATTTIAELALAGPHGVDLSAAVSDLWVRLSSVLGQPSTASRILFQELSAHTEFRQRSAEAHKQVVAVVSEYLAIACGHNGTPQLEHDAAAELLTIAAAINPMLSPPGTPTLDPETIAFVIALGLKERTL
jgi:AcrR family transcriptional regulator